MYLHINELRLQLLLYEVESMALAEYMYATCSNADEDERSSPNHMVRSSGPLMLMKLAWHSLAMAFARRVFPHPANSKKGQLHML